MQKYRQAHDIQQQTPHTTGAESYRRSEMTTITAGVTLFSVNVVLVTAHHVLQVDNHDVAV